MTIKKERDLLLNIKKCVMCNSTNVPSVELDIPLKSKYIKSVKADGARCSQCGEEYYDVQTLKAIEEIEKGLEEKLNSR